MRKRFSRRLAAVAATTVVAAAGVVATGGTASADRNAAQGIIWNDEVLTRGSDLRNGNAQLAMQDDGNLVIYTTSDDWAHRTPVWRTGTVGCGDRAVMQSDGNFVVYGQNNRVCWASNTAQNEIGTNYPVMKLGLGPDGTLRVFSEAPYIIQVWSTR
ncbi:hypothetical protein FHS39_002259 [Streptomyces olivoverticillatus]|uniref:Bulb-type lectin domain-containing protein n=1 Tax=Streptomyces olivoverticillatus TaxID=66427 RepID=A0A7W7LMZ5_9ACTN|nr:hypothetical protein [Streptomyces olivoverticillatus]MBB4893228.1 hypothetical protein [Streptomyces olivoverticillatus]